MKKYEKELLEKLEVLETRIYHLSKEASSIMMEIGKIGRFFYADANPKKGMKRQHKT